MPFIFGAISYFRRDARLIGLLVVMIAASVGLGLLHAWPMAILIDTVLARTPRSTWIHSAFLNVFGNSKMAQIVGLALTAMVLKIILDALWMLRDGSGIGFFPNGLTGLRAPVYFWGRRLGVRGGRRFSVTCGGLVRGR